MVLPTRMTTHRTSTKRFTRRRLMKTKTYSIPCLPSPPRITMNSSRNYRCATPNDIRPFPYAISGVQSLAIYLITSDSCCEPCERKSEQETDLTQLERFMLVPDTTMCDPVQL
uniref:Uncharacterized protein n=1 Tax=Anopheles culicifacies TaxID=139723 RepID=A0A182LT73_9DIPT